MPVLILSQLCGCGSSQKQGDRWRAPLESNALKNPLVVNEITQEKGHALFNLYCRSCHGETGRGDGAAGRQGNGPTPANFHDDHVQSQTDGALLWKLNMGRGNMPAFKEVLSDEQKWQLISYIRKLPFLVSALIPPKALRPDIKIEHMMFTAPLAVRILQHPVTGDLWYTTFNGDVYRIKGINTNEPTSEKIFSEADHGIGVLQGAAFVGDTLFLCGNVYSKDKSSTKGRMVRFEHADSSNHKMDVVFNTVEYGANKTIYDHGWNAMVVSPDHKFIFVNSGARTDHGEVQDNGGIYPNARDNGLTAKIFRFPVNATNLYLSDDEKQLEADGYLFAKGIRNAYDLAFDEKGNLFGVSNSADYDYPEDMFWIREKHHYGFPWIMGGLENPQQYRGWKPDPATDSFINRASHSWQTKYYYEDTGFPARPAGVRFSPGVQNVGPDANQYRGHSGKVQDGDETGVAVSTFTAHSSPLGLFFDTKKVFSNDLNDDGFVIRYSLGATSVLMKPFTDEGADLLQLHLTYDSVTDNYSVRTKRIVEGFNEPVDAVLVDNVAYIIEYGGKRGNIWKIIFPKAAKDLKRNERNKNKT
jgi:hypothetical protein